MRHRLLVIALSLAGANALAESPPIVMPVAAGHSGSWFDPNPQRAGQGIILNVIAPNRAVMTWNTFATDGTPLWLVGDGAIRAGRIEFRTLAVAGGRFPGTGTTAPQTSDWGSVTLEFPNCDAATMRWTPAPGSPLPSGSTSLARLTQPLALACDDDRYTWRWTDLGAPPAGGATLNEGRSAVVVGGEVIVATADGLWRRRYSGTSAWERAGLPGFDAGFVIADDEPDGRLFAGGIPRDRTEQPVHVSHDGGRSWVAATQTFFDTSNNRHEGFADVAVSPEDPNLVYASLEGGAGISVSTDGGRTFRRADGSTDSFFGYNCHIAFVPGVPRRLYQGCEQPLDFIRIGYYTIDPGRPDRLGEMQLIARTDPQSPNDTQNRRPQRLIGSTGRPGTLYIGAEGALFGFDATSGAMERVYYSPMEDNGTVEPYIYVDALWIDPRDPFRVVFGGGLNGINTRVALYETRDHGLGRAEIPQPPFTISNPAVDTLVPLDSSGDHFVVVIDESSTQDPSDDRLRVLKLDRVRQ